MSEGPGISPVSDYLVYEVKECILYFKDRDQNVLSGEIHSMSLGCNYNGAEVFPEFMISLSLDRKTFFDIMKEKDSLTMLLKVAYYVNTPQETEGADKGRERVWFNEKFVVYLDEKHFDVMVNQKAEMDEEFKNTDRDKNDITQHKEYNIDLFLFKESDVETAYSVCNKVITSADKNTVITYLLNQSNAKNVLMSPLQNSSLSEVTLLPITTVGNLRYLEAQYGLHSHGTLVFFDLDKTYILNKKIGCTAWVKGEYKNVVFVIREDTSEKAFMGGTRLNPDDDIVYVNVSPENITYRSFTSMDSLIYGGRIKSVNTYTSDTKTISAEGTARKLHDKYMHNKYQNTLQEQAMQQRLNDRGMVATINIPDGNVHWFRPNKDFKFTYQKSILEKSLGGKYRITSLFMKFTNYGEHFRNETSMSFSKEI